MSEEFHAAMAAINEPRIPAWTPEWFGFTDNGMKWLADKGLEWVKVCADPGDLIVWDSRTPHYNVPPAKETTQDRFAIYTCFMPVRDASMEDLRRKREAFESMFSFPDPFSCDFVGVWAPLLTMGCRTARDDALAERAVRGGNEHRDAGWEA